MKMLAVGLALSLLTAAPDDAAHSCEVYWRYIGGKEDPEYLRVVAPWPLLRFAREQPEWYYDARDSLRWRPVSRPPAMRSLGRLDGHALYEVAYSGMGRALVWDQGDWQFCPALIFDAEALVEKVHPARVFRWHDIDVVHVRIQLSGQGHIQESLFFAVVEGALVHLREETASRARIDAFLEARGMRLFHRGLGFCEGSLVEQRIAEFKDRAPHAGGRTGLIVTWRLDGNNLVADRIELGPVYPFDKGCEVFPP